MGNTFNSNENVANFTIERLSIECRKTKTKVITPKVPNQKKGKQLKGPMRIQTYDNQMAQSAGHKGVISFSFASDWLRK